MCVLDEHNIVKSCVLQSAVEGVVCMSLSAGDARCASLAWGWCQLLYVDFIYMYRTWVTQAAAAGRLMCPKQACRWLETVHMHAAAAEAHDVMQ